MTTLFFNGAEIPGWRTLLHDNRVRHMAFSYVGLTRRVKHTELWNLAEKFPDDVEIIVESGGHSVNKDPDKYDVPALAEAYVSFVAANVDRAHTVTEFDAKVLNPSYRLQLRHRLHRLAGDKFLPVWHEADGLGALTELAQTYGRVGVSQTVVGKRDITPALQALVRQGVRLHGVAMTQIEAVRQIPWDTIASTSWLSPAQYADTIVWTGNELKRYPKKYKDQARKRHRSLFIREGFDAELIEAGDVTESLRLSIWSWMSFLDDLNRDHRHGGTSTPAQSYTRINAETAGDAVGTPTPQVRNDVGPFAVTPRVLNRRDRTRLPGVGVQEKTVREIGDDGERTSRTIRLLDTEESGARTCDTCFLAGKCPQFQPETECAFDLPVEAKTRDQLARIQEVLIEIQTQRVLFARFSEEVEGGYPDPNVGQEIDRLQKMLKTKSDMESEGFTIAVKAQSRSQGQAGLIGRIFGDGASQAARAIEPARAEVVASQLGIVDAELVGE